MRNKCITIMKKLTKTKVIRISETQHKTLQKMKSYNVDVGNFIRNAIAEKIQREYKYLIPKEDLHTDLEKQLKAALNQIFKQ